MAKGPTITPAIRQRVATVFLKHPEWRAKEIQAEVSIKDWPSISAVEKMLADIRKKFRETSGQISVDDLEWQVSLIPQYPIVPLAVKKVYELKLKGVEWISVRNALWISRLCELPLSIDVLYYYAVIYSLAEQANELTDNVVPDTRDIDALLQSDLNDPERAMLDMGRFDEPVPPEFEKEFWFDVLKTAIDIRIKKDGE